VALELYDSRGNIIAHVRGRLSDLGWQGTPGRHRLHEPSIPYPHVFRPNTEESYTLTISYKGDPELIGMSGFASIECGGHK
jgi:hypothetical protein